MRPTHALHRLLICALAAWMSLCCCEKRLLASFVSADAETACCQDDCCCADDGRDADQAPEGGSSRDHRSDSAHCGDGCCSKAAIMAVVPQIDIDSIGALLPDSLRFDAIADTRTVTAPAVDRSDGEPPPRLTLLISARLRI